MIGKAEAVIKAMADALREDPDKLYEVKEWHKKRTLTQNAYYWALLTQVTKKLIASGVKITVPELHNRMLRDTAPAQTVDGKTVCILLPDLDETEKKALASETVHLRRTSGVTMGNNGMMYRQYVLLKGSSMMKTDEMAALLDNLIAEAQQIGVETLTWRELQEMRDREKRKEERHASEHHAES